MINMFIPFKRYFLMVGHTHEEVDQMLFRISVHLTYISCAEVSDERCVPSYTDGAAF